MGKDIPISTTVMWLARVSARRCSVDGSKISQTTRLQRGFVPKRSMEMSSIERAVGLTAANHFIESMEHNSKYIDTPLISVGDPANVSSWEWSTGLDSSPKYSMEQLVLRGKGALDPFQMVQKDIGSLSGGIKELLGSDHPVLETCAKYFFDMDGGKKIRPTMVLGVAYALNAHLQANKRLFPAKPVAYRNTDSRSSDAAVVSGGSSSDSSSGSCSSVSKDVSALAASTMHADAAISADDHGMFATPSQRRLAEITEMIHTASLFHDDVIDKATTRRNMSSVNQVFGNKLAILGGDFLLSRASVSLARLRNLEVVELLSTVIEHLVKGEIMQMKPSVSGRSALEYYLRKNFYKTASLMGHSCLAAAVLGGHSEECKRASYLYGTYVGQAFQLIDDALDFEGTTQQLGKAPLADLKSGLATAPTLFAAEEHPKLLMLIERKFELPGDVDEALTLVLQSNGLQRCKDLAQVHVERAIEAIEVLQDSEARSALIALACKVVTRTH